MKKNTYNFLTSQHEISKKALITRQTNSPKNISRRICADPVQFVKSLSKGKRSTLNHLLWCFRNWTRVRPSQARIAAKVGLTREYLNTIIAEFVEIGFIGMESGKATYNTCTYTLNKFFDDQKVMQKLRHLLPAIFYFSVALLSSRMAAEKNLTPYSIYSCINIYLQSNTNSNSRARWVGHKKRRLEMELPTIKGIPLTTAGQISFAPYPKEVLEYIELELKKGNKGITDLFKWAHAKANGHCKRTGIKPNWRNKFTLQEQYGISDNDPMLSATKSQSAPAFKESQQGERQSFGKFRSCHSFCSQLLNTSQCSVMSTHARNMQAEQLKSEKYLQSGKKISTERKDDHRSYDESMKEAQEYFMKHIAADREKEKKAYEVANLVETFSDGQPLYQTEEEPDDIYYPGRPDSSSQTANI